MISYKKASSENIGEIENLLAQFDGDRREISASQFVVAKDSEKLVGCVRIKELSPDCLELASLAVKSEYRKQGIGSELVKKMLSAEQRRPIYLLCSSDTQNFYKRNGFKLSQTDALPKILMSEYQRIVQLPFTQNIKVIAMACGAGDI